MSAPVLEANQLFDAQGDAAESPRLLPRQQASAPVRGVEDPLRGSGQPFLRRAQAATPSVVVLPSSAPSSGLPQPSAALQARSGAAMQRVLQEGRNNRRLKALAVLATVGLIAFAALGMANRRESNSESQSMLSSLQSRAQWYVDHPYTSIPAAFLIYSAVQAIGLLIKQ